VVCLFCTGIKSTIPECVLHVQFSETTPNYSQKLVELDSWFSLLFRPYLTLGLVEKFLPFLLRHLIAWSWLHYSSRYHQRVEISHILHLIVEVEEWCDLHSFFSPFFIVNLWLASSSFGLIMLCAWFKYFWWRISCYIWWWYLQWGSSALPVLSFNNLISLITFLELKP